jgi:nitric oxide reductase NorQ protein
MAKYADRLARSNPADLGKGSAATMRTAFVTEAPDETVRVVSDDDRVVLEAGEDFVLTPQVRELTERALMYLEVGYPVHFAGPSGTGKTTLAFHVAARLGRAVVLIHGDDEFSGSDLIGRDAGYRKSRLVDNYIHSVLKTEEEMRTLWMDNRLVTACQRGYTVIYDEFTRSRPEANNALLSILAEKILNLPKLRRSGEGYMEVHPDFRAVFTSNPEEYAGTHKTQDALLDRLITIQVGHYDRETEVHITMAKSGIARRDAETVVDVVREFRTAGANRHRPTVRACIAIGRVLAHRSARARPDDPVFRQVCRDVLNTDAARVTCGGEPVPTRKVDQVLRKACGTDATCVVATPEVALSAQ